MRKVIALLPFGVAIVVSLWSIVDPNAPLHYAFTHYDRKDVLIQACTGLLAAGICWWIADKII